MEFEAASTLTIKVVVCIELRRLERKDLEKRVPQPPQLPRKKRKFQLKLLRLLLLLPPLQLQKL